MHFSFIISSLFCLSNHKRLGSLLYSSEKDIHDDDSNAPLSDPVDSGIPCLPPIGDTSYDPQNNENSVEKTIRLGDSPQKVAKVGGHRFQLQYTCKICETRNSHKVSRMAYRKGVVIALCKGCQSKHLIADNLGWTDYKGGFEGSTSNIEEFMEEKGRSDEVNRVSPDVFELESNFHRNPDENNEEVTGFE